MPVKWGSEADAILLTKMFETNPGLSVDAAAIAEAWPVAAGANKPTPRAIKERITKIRSTGNTKTRSGKGTKKTAIRVKPSAVNGVSPNQRGVPISAITTPKQTSRVKPLMTENSNGASILDIDDASDKTDDNNDRNGESNASPKSKVTMPSNGLPTPQSQRKKSMTPHGKPNHRRDAVLSETDSDHLTDLETLLKGESRKIQTRGKQVAKYESDEGEPESEISEFGKD